MRPLRPDQATAFTGFLSWHITEDARAICPHCLTPNDRRVDGAIAAADPDDELLRTLDPDNETPEDTR